MRPGLVETGIDAENILDTVRESLIVLDGDLCVISANEAFFRTFEVSPEETMHRRIYELGNGEWDIPRLRELLESVIPERSTIEGFEVTHLFNRLGERTMILNARRIYREDAHIPLILLAVEDITKEHEAERKLQRSELEYRNRTENLNSIVVELDAKGSIVFFNRFSEALFQYSRSEVIEKPFFGYIVPHVDSRNNDMSGLFQELLEMPEDFYARQSEGIRKDGSRVWFSWSANALRNDRGEIYQILIDGNDITELEAARKELEEKSGTLEALLDSIPEGIIVTDEHHVIHQAGRYLEELLGVAPTDVLHTDETGRLDLVELSWPDGTRITRPDELPTAQAAKTGKRFTDIEMNLAFDGSTKVISANAAPIRDSEGRIVGAACGWRDVTDRRHSEEALRESEERFRTLADNISQLVWMADPNGSIFWYNKRWYDYTGTSPLEMQQKGWKFIPHPDHLESLERSYRQAIHAGQPWEMTFPMRNKDGEYRWFLTRAMPIRDSGGNIVRWFGTNTDINDRKQLEEELSRRAAELDAVNRDLESFSYSVSHDLRNPLHIISSFADILKDEYSERLDDGGRDFLRRIDESADKMQVLIDNLLALSRIGREGLHREPIELSRIAQEFLNELAASQPSRKTETIVFPDIQVHADPRLVPPAIENLLRNAWKFTSERDTTIIEFGEIHEGGRTIYYVTDNGIGFDMRFAETIFEPFKRVHGQKEYGGTGIGLSIVQRVIDRHGGKIWAKGEVGKGASFYFTLGSD